MRRERNGWRAGWERKTEQNGEERRRRTEKSEVYSVGGEKGKDKDKGIEMEEEEER